MRLIILILSFGFFFTFSSFAQSDYSEDLTSIDNVIDALYGVISGDKGVERDWDRFRNLFIPEAKLVPSSKNKEGKLVYRIMSPDDYINSSGRYLVENGFHEVEIHRVTEQYGSLLHLWSTYESYRQKSDTHPFMRGINSIQLIKQGEGWKIVQIYWLGETEDNALPAKYLPK